MAVEEPEFERVLQEAEFEVRAYPALVAAQVQVTGKRSEAVNAGFRLLAGYIFGNNTARQSIAMTAPVMQASTQGESIAMTAPVMQTEAAPGAAGASGEAWSIQFVMPKKHSLQSLPTPNDARVRLTMTAPARYAVVRFSGLAGEAAIAQKTANLCTFMRGHQLRQSGPPTLARYDPPWTLWFLRRNEILMPIQP